MLRAEGRGGLGSRRTVCAELLAVGSGLTPVEHLPRSALSLSEMTCHLCCVTQGSHQPWEAAVSPLPRGKQGSQRLSDLPRVPQLIPLPHKFGQLEKIPKLPGFCTDQRSPNCTTSCPLGLSAGGKDARQDLGALLVFQMQIWVLLFRR